MSFVQKILIRFVTLSHTDVGNKQEQSGTACGRFGNNREQLMGDSGTDRNKWKQLVNDSLESLLNDATRTKRGRIFELYETIIGFRTKGVSIAKIENCLNEVCFADDNLAKGSLKTYLTRIRKEKEKKRANGTAPVTPAVSVVALVPVAAVAAVAAVVADVASAEVVEVIPETKVTPPESSRRTSNGLPDLEALEKEARARFCRPEPRRTNF
jgi:hypothetical protein